MFLNCCRKVPGSKTVLAPTVINQVCCCFFRPTWRTEGWHLITLLTYIPYEYSSFTSQRTSCDSIRETNRLIFGRKQGIFCQNSMRLERILWIKCPNSRCYSRWYVPPLGFKRLNWSRPLSARSSTIHYSLTSKYLRQSTLIHSTVCLTTGHNLFQNKFPTQCDLVLPLSVYSNLTFLKATQ